MWEEYSKNNPTIPDCCEDHRQLVRAHFYAGVIALHRYVTGTEFLAVEAQRMVEQLDEEIAAFEIDDALNRKPLGSEKVQ